MSGGVFVDSWAWIAMLDKRDPGHQAATEAYRSLRAAGTVLTTSSVVIYETVEHLRRRFGLEAALRLWALVEAAAGMCCVWCTPSTATSSRPCCSP